MDLGCGFEIAIKDLAELIAGFMDFKGQIAWDKSKPDGQPRRMLDVTRARKAFEFRTKTGFEDGLRKTIEWFLISSKR